MNNVLRAGITFSDLKLQATAKNRIWALTNKNKHIVYSVNSLFPNFDTTNIFNFLFPVQMTLNDMLKLAHPVISYSLGYVNWESVNPVPGINKNFSSKKKIVHKVWPKEC